MARYTGPVCRLCRRERMKLFLKGTKCETTRCPIERRPYPPGMHGRGRIRESEYLFQLREKQKARRIYGLLEKQFKLIYNKANKQPGVTGTEHDVVDAELEQAQQVLAGHAGLLVGLVVDQL